MRHATLLSVFAFILSISSSLAQPAPRIEMEVIGFLPGLDFIGPLAINDHGQVVGTARSADSKRGVAFTWTRVTGFRVIADDGFASGINNRGDVVGRRCTSRDDRGFCEDESGGFVWNARTGFFRDLGNVNPSGINENGDVAADCNGPIACTIRDGVATDLASECSTDSCYSVSSAINAAGDVVGVTYLFEYPGGPFINSYAMLWPRSGGEVQLGIGTANAINDAGTVAGESPSGATLWTRRGTLLTDPGSLSTSARGINARGWAVGVGRGSDATTRAFFWNPSSGSPILNLAPQFSNAQASDINNRGEVVGVAEIGGAGRLQAVIWRVSSTQQLHIETPNAPSRWGLNTRQRLAWTYSGDAPQFQIEITRNSGKTWDYLTTVANAAGDSQNFDWQVMGPLTSAAKFRVTAIADAEASDINDANIRIANATIEVLSPSETTAAGIGTVLKITMKHSLGARAPIAIDVSHDNGTSWRTAAEPRTTGSTTSSFQWVVDLPPTTKARVRVRALDGSGAKATSRAFSVTAGGSQP